MNKFKFLLVVLAIAFPMFVSQTYAAQEIQLDRLEFGLSAGVGFYLGQNEVGDFTRLQCYDIMGSTIGGRTLKTAWPGIETFGFSLGYRFNTMFNIKAQATRQRITFMEYEGANDKGNLYYNAMWHTDLMLEYNILPYGVVRGGSSGGIYNIVPYLGLGLGATVYNQDATLRNATTLNGDHFTRYPRVGYKQKWDLVLDELGQPIKGANGQDSVSLQWKKSGMGVALYIPVAIGAKWRIDEHWQLKASFQYQLYFASPSGILNSNIDGGTYLVDNIYKDNIWIDNDIVTPNRPTLNDVPRKVVGGNHDFLFSLTAIFNFSTWHEERIVEY